MNTVIIHYVRSVVIGSRLRGNDERRDGQPYYAAARSSSFIKFAFFCLT
jgi:hypothetical protein